ncbi:MAG: hypothetical protein F6K56_25905 [Moorea sp. SIO3G5]|nr:hypothetical protein [Moorena sp. SIO3G5]
MGEVLSFWVFREQGIGNREENSSEIFPTTPYSLLPTPFANSIRLLL